MAIEKLQIELWDQVERAAKEWSVVNDAPAQAIPLERLRPLWESVAEAGVTARESLRAYATAHENILLRTENQLLKMQLERVKVLRINRRAWSEGEVIGEHSGNNPPF